MAQPGNPIAWNRYAYVYNSPTNHTGSSGHLIDTLWDVVAPFADAQATEPTGNPVESALYYMLNDALGSTTVVADDEGTPLVRTLYDPFGGVELTEVWKEGSGWTADGSLPPALTDHLYRIEGSCNSYLVTTPGGSVLIDPAGAAAAPQYFKHLLTRYPLKAILLTHAHRDHWDHMEIWRSDETIPLIAQRNFLTYNKYWKRLAPFFARRGAVWGRQPLPDPAKTEAFNPVVPSVTFADEHTLELGGFHFNMIHTSGETPDQTFIWIPELEAAFVGDNYYAWFINNATLRGTLPRPISGYLHTLDLAISRGSRLLLPGHGTPVVSKGAVRETVTNLRDALKYIYDETIKGINQGKDVHTLMREIKVPDRHKIRPYYGKVEWTVRGIYHGHIGWFDENPASMYGEPASGIHADLTELAGAEAIITRAEKYLQEKRYVKVLHLMDVILNAQPSHREANQTRLKALRALRAGTFNYIERIWLDYGIRVSEEMTGKSAGGIPDRRKER